MSNERELGWADQTVLRAGRRMAELRKQRGLSARSLAEATRAAGHEVSQGAIAKIETGARGMTMPELLIIARALSVPPWLLLVDLTSEEPVEFWPGRRVHPWEVVRWFRGDQLHLPSGGETPSDEDVKSFMRWTEFETFWDSVRADDEQWVNAYLDLAHERSELEKTPSDRRETPEYRQALSTLERMERLVERRREQLEERIRELTTKWSREIGLLGRRADALQFAVSPEVAEAILEATAGFGLEPMTEPDDGDDGDR